MLAVSVCPLHSVWLDTEIGPVQRDELGARDGEFNVEAHSSSVLGLFVGIACEPGSRGRLDELGETLFSSGADDLLFSQELNERSQQRRGFLQFVRGDRLREAIERIIDVLGRDGLRAVRERGLKERFSDSEPQRLVFFTAGLGERLNPLVDGVFGDERERFERREPLAHIGRVERVGLFGVAERFFQHDGGKRGHALQSSARLL